LLETLAEQSKNANNTKMRQYNTANKNPHNYSTRPVQRASHNSGAHAKPRPNVSHVQRSTILKEVTILRKAQTLKE